MLEAKALDELEPQLAILGTIVPLCRREFHAAEEWGRKNLDLHPISQVGRAFYAEALERTVGLRRGWLNTGLPSHSPPMRYGFARMKEDAWRGTGVRRMPPRSWRTCGGSASLPTLTRIT